MDTNRPTPFPTLITGRCELRQITLNDCNEIFQLLTDKEVNKYYGRPRAENFEDACKYVETIISATNKRSLFYWAIFLKDEPHLAGTVCLWNFRKEERRAEIGYELLPQFQRKGIMREALGKVVDFAFETLPVKAIDAWPNAENYRAIKILENYNFKRDTEAESKIDWSKEAEFYSTNEKEKKVTTVIYTKTKDSWQTFAP